MPEGITAPVAAPAAAAPAASTPSSPAPVSTPVSTPAATPVAAPASVPASIPSAIDAAAAATPASEAALAAVSDRPKRSDFPDDAGGIEQFLRANNAWEDANPDGTQFVTGDEVPVEGKAPEAAAADKTPEDAEKPAEEKPADETRPAESQAPATPEALSKLFEGNEARKAFIEGDPELKGALFSMARQNAKAAPILEVFPNVEAAKFAQTASNDFVTLKTGITLADTPEKMADAVTGFLDQFKLVDAKGEPVLDAAGQVQYGDDLPLFKQVLLDADRSMKFNDLKARIEANTYASAEGRDNDEQLLAAYEFIAAAEAAGPDALDKPDLESLSPEARAYLEREQKKIADERERLGIKDKTLTKQQTAAVREQNKVEYRKQFGGSVGRYLGNYLKQKEADGVVVPHYLVQMQDKDGVSVFAKVALDKLNAKLDGLSSVRANSATYEMNAINEDGLKARVAYGQGLVDEHLPGIIDGLLKEAGVSTKADADAKIATRDAGRADARTEPAAGLPSSPKHMSDEQVMAQAKANVEKKYGSTIDDRRKIEETLKERDRLESSAR